MSKTCAACSHPEVEHGQERFLDVGTDSKRELCLLCPGYVVVRGGNERSSPGRCHGPQPLEA